MSRERGGRDWRRSAGPPGLVRALADLPRERLDRLADWWRPTASERPGAVAALYRQMTDPAVLEERLAALGEAERLVFATLAGVGRPMRAGALGRRLPFPGPQLAELLAALAERGLVWPWRMGERTAEAAGAAWYVPQDLALPRVRRAARDGAPPPAPPAPPGSADLRRLEGPPAPPRPAGAVPRWLTGRVGGPPAPTTERPVVVFAAHCGAALGVLSAQGGPGRPGPRAAAWRALDDGGRVRALVRLWRIDDRVSGLPSMVRRGLLAVLAGLAPGAWYDAAMVGRAVARWTVADAGGGVRRGAVLSAPAGTAVARRDLDRALEQLRWLGLLQTACTARGQVLAVARTPESTPALA